MPIRATTFWDPQSHSKPAPASAAKPVTGTCSPIRSGRVESVRFSGSLRHAVAKPSKLKLCPVSEAAATEGAKSPAAKTKTVHARAERDAMHAVRATGEPARYPAGHEDAMVRRRRRRRRDGGRPRAAAPRGAS